MSKDFLSLLEKGSVCPTVRDCLTMPESEVSVCHTVHRGIRHRLFSIWKFGLNAREDVQNLVTMAVVRMKMQIDACSSLVHIVDTHAQKL